MILNLYIQDCGFILTLNPQIKIWLVKIVFLGRIFRKMGEKMALIVSNLHHFPSKTANIS
jgi:hypothetical protein